MKRFFKKIVIFSVTIMIIFIVVVYNNYKFVKKQSNFLLEKDVENLILGNSHPECALNDGLIDKTINLASSAESYFYTYYKLKTLLEENKQIKNVFLEFGYSGFNKHSETWLWESAHHHKYSTIIDREGFVSLFFKNPINTIKIVIKEKPSPMIVDFWGGYLFLKRDKLQADIDRHKEKIDSASDNSNYVSTIQLRYFKKIINLCQKNNVSVYLIRNPMYKSANRYDNVIFKIKNDYFKNVEFLDFVNFPLKDEEYGDIHHLNYKGAKTFSLFFNQLIKDGLLKSEDKQSFIRNVMEKR